MKAEETEKPVEQTSEEVVAAIEASEFNENLAETLYDGVLGFGISLGNGVALMAGAISRAGDQVQLGLLAAGCAIIIAIALMLTCMLSDHIQKKSSNRLVVALFVICTLCSFGCNIFGYLIPAGILACVSLVTVIIMYSGFLTILPHKALMMVVDIAFIYTGIMVAALQTANGYMIPIQAVAIVVSLVFTATFQTRYAVRHKTISAEESKKNNIKVKGNSHTLVLVGFMLGASAYTFTIAPDLSYAVVTVGLAILASGLICLLARSFDERPFKEFMRKSMAASSCILLVIPLLPDEGKLVCMGIYLFFVCTNINIILNAIVETSRFNIISSVWLFGQQGAYFAAGAAGGVLLYVLGELAHVLIGVEKSHVMVLVLVVFICCCLQILVNYQIYPFEPELEEAEPEVNAEVESAGKRKALWQQKIDATCNLYRLSPRETEVLHILLRGRDVKYIMDKFCISQSTAKTHVYNIYRKLGIHSRQELIDFVEDMEVAEASSEV